MENNRIKINETVIVEGKYDKIRLSSFVDANIIELGGFRIYKNKENLALIRRIAEKTGIVILTDSDSAGFKLRHYLSSAIPAEKIKNVYIPDVEGKEKRKTHRGKEGLIGVEGMTTEALLNAFSAAGITQSGENIRKEPLTKAYLYEIGLSGRENSAALRNKICEHYSLPKMLSANALAEVLPVLTDISELSEVVEKIKSEEI